MKQEEQKNQAKRIAQEIQDQIKKIFVKHKRTVNRMNDQKKFGGPLNKNDKSEKIFAELAEVSKQLKVVQKKIHECQKLRKQRRQLFGKKASSFNEAIKDLIQNKNIRIKVNPQIQKLAARSTDVIKEVQRALILYEKQSSTLCGKAYDYKPMVQKTFLELAQLGFLWENIPKFDSVTNQSVKELYLPVDYDASDFQQLESQVMKLWPQPKEVQKVVYQKPPPQIIEYKSQLQYAHQLLFGFARPQELYKSLLIYQKEANRQNPDPTALNSLGILYQEGRGVSKDATKAFRYFLSSAKKGDPEGLYKVGKYLEKGLLNFKQQFEGLYANRQAEIRGGIEYYEKAAAKGHLDALTDLGYIYELGIMKQDQSQYIIDPHPEHAKKYYQKAKNQQYPRAFNNLGNLLIKENMENNVNYTQNALTQKGIKYLEKAVQLNYPKAFINLGKCYLTGTGVNLNVDKARGLFKEAAELGEVHGRLEYLKSFIGANIQEQKVMSDLVDSARMVLLEDKNNVQALYIMGIFQQKGIGMNPNKEASFHYITAAARLQYPPALTRLGDYYYSGYFVDKNYESAKILYEKAGERGQSQALLNLAIMQDNGLLPAGNTLGDAEQLYKRAEDMGNTNATLMRGLKKQGNIDKSSKVFQAAQLGNLRALKLLNDNKKSTINLTKKQDQMKKLSTFYLKQISHSRKRQQSLF